MTQRRNVIPDSATTEAATRFFEAGQIPAEAQVHRDDELVAVARAFARWRADGAELDDAVRAAREAGRSWEAIGAATEMTRQGATSRWAKVTEPHNASA